MSDSVIHDSPRASGMNGVLLLLGLSVFINYIDRTNLSVAAPLLRDELGLSHSQLGLLLSAFFWTYACMQVLAGWLVDRFEVKWILAIGFLAWSLATAFTGALHAFAALLTVRVILGVGESVAYPAYAKIFANHFVESQRGFANSIVGAGQSLGPALGILFGGILVARFGWRPFFLVLGLVSLLWLPPWFRWMPRTAATGVMDMRRGPGLSEIFHHRSSWGTWIGHFCANYFLYFLLTWLPYYLQRERHFSADGMSKIGGTTFLLAALSSPICGWLSDRWISAGATPTRVRKTFMGVGMACNGLFLVGCAAAPNRLLVVLLLLAGGSFGLVSSNLNAITQTLAGPHAVGRWMGAQNFVANLAGAVAPALTGFLVGRTGKFYWPFLITSVIAWVGAVHYVLVVGPVEPVVWKMQTKAITPDIPRGVRRIVGPRSVIQSCPMSQEVEIKFRVVDLRALAHKLRVAGFRATTPRTHELNTLYDLPGEVLRGRKELLRIRKYGSAWTLTHKAKGKVGRHSSRLELETAVGDGQKMDLILRALGYATSFRYEKFRAEWTDGKGHVVVDETPIGNFCEIEGASRWIDATAKKLGVAAADYITKNYAALFLDWKARTKSEAREMTFKAVKRHAD